MDAAGLKTTIIATAKRISNKAALAKPGRPSAVLRLSVAVNTTAAMMYWKWMRLEAISGWRVVVRFVRCGSRGLAPMG
jgi:hypothetical protein